MAESELLSLLRKLTACLENRNWDGNQVNSLLSAMVPATKAASRIEQDDALAEMSRFVGSAPAQEGGIVALCAGTVIESGGAPDVLYEAIIKRLPSVLISAKKLVDDVNVSFPEQKDAKGSDDSFWVANTPVPREWIQAHVQADREPVGAFNMLKEWCLPLISICGRNRSYLENLTSQKDLQLALIPLCRYIAAADFLYLLTAILLNESVLFFNLASQRAFLLTIDSVPNNFALHTLLAAALAEPLGLTAPASAVLECVNGIGPGTCRIPSFGYWNLYSYKALPFAPELDQAPKMEWIWNEGTPADIPGFEGHKIIVAGENKIARSWNTQRIFEYLKPSVKLVRELNDEERADYLRRMNASN